MMNLSDMDAYPVTSCSVNIPNSSCSVEEQGAVEYTLTECTEYVQTRNSVPGIHHTPTAEDDAE